MKAAEFSFFLLVREKWGLHPIASSPSVVGLSKAQARGERGRECKVAILSGFCGGGGGGGGKGDEILRDAGGPREVGGRDSPNL